MEMMGMFCGVMAKITTTAQRIGHTLQSVRCYGWPAATPSCCSPLEPHVMRREPGLSDSLQLAQPSPVLHFGSFTRTWAACLKLTYHVSSDGSNTHPSRQSNGRSESKGPNRKRNWNCPFNNHHSRRHSTIGDSVYLLHRKRHSPPFRIF